MPPKIDFAATAVILTSGIPLSFKAYPDGSLVVIAHDGSKHKFTAEQVQNAQPKPVLKSDPKPVSKPAPRRGRPPKAK
jgi:hypothetical protein